MSPAEAVGGFLDALGVPPERVPPTLDTQAALYRSLLAGTRVLVVLDNARDVAQVQPLLPGTPTAVTVVTSRDHLTSLVAAHGARPLTLDLLTEDEARRLLVTRLGAARVAAEPDAVARIVARTARLPLALTIAAARAAQSGFPLASVAAELDRTDRSLDALSAGDAASQVRAVFSWSSVGLTPAAARLFRLLGLHPGPDVAAAAAASLAGEGIDVVRPLLAELAAASLLTEHRPGCFTFHDLLRAYAAELAQTADTADHRGAALVRMLDHYLHSAHAADRLLQPARDPMTLALAPPAPGVVPERHAEQADALGWLVAERPVLLAVPRQAVEAGFDAHAWQLAWALDTFLYGQGHWRDLTVIWRTALDASGRLGDQRAEAYAHRSLARACIRLSRFSDATGHLLQALDLYDSAGDRAGQAYVHHGLAMVFEQRRRPGQALGQARQALALYESAGHRAGQARGLNAVGWYQALLGHHRQALAACRQALTLHQQLGDRLGEAHAWDSLGYAYHLGRRPQATDCYRQALSLFRTLDDRYAEAATLTRLGDHQSATGDPEAARGAWQQALRILTDLDHPDADAVRAKLAGSRA